MNSVYYRGLTSSEPSRPAQMFAGIRKPLIALFSAVLLAALAISPSADAKTKTKKAKAAPAAAAQAYTPPFSALVMDAATGTILMSNSGNDLRHPASLTKVMTLYILFSELDAGRVDFFDKIKISRHAANQAPSRLGLQPGQSIEVHDAIQALAVKSANDIATAVGEHLSGSEQAFARRMTETARRLGMTKTTFLNASGLPNKEQWTTAHDMAMLGWRMQRDFPEYYSYFNAEKFTWQGQTFYSHNRFMRNYEGADGLKTGFTNASGFNLVASADRFGKRLIGVVMGGTTAQARDKKMAQIFDDVFAQTSRPQKVAGVMMSGHMTP
ncbi:D-alanyl-D-alanine carboxypeptidase family protein [Govanella unica]|uniref:D-alanyl-D-alanine carboxypeptidase n=1 Tax=Govanella unica TaxID=2975056 RepID=A0A9X3Z6H7_9PROT|nr:D-alanyl-D-alanine carboxypeptidase family protein [Govania unica]MDA5193141.1 D-alanyl-D-alanine carboxypeptidase [Govania unica]